MKKDYSDCHYPGLFSFWASDDVRVYYASNGIPFDEDGIRPISFHQHRYDLDFHVLNGALINSELFAASINRASSIFHYGYMGTVLNDGAVNLRVSHSGYARLENDLFVSGESFSMEASQFHTVVATPQTAWAVREGKLSHRDPMVAFDSRGVSFKNDLYNPFTPEMIGVALYTKLVEKAREVFNA